MKSNKTIDLIDLFGGSTKQDERVYSRSAINVHEFYLSGTIESSDNYIAWYDIIRHATQNDVIKIYINSYGGDMFAAIQFLRVLNDTPATVIVSVEGACMSAATMIFMCADQIEISEHSMFMFHNYSGGAFGKGGEMFEQLRHERDWSEKLLREIYSDFLTEKEIQQMLDNKDLWMDGDEVVKRVEKKIKKAKKNAKASGQLLIENVEDE